MVAVKSRNLHKIRIYHESSSVQSLKFLGVATVVSLCRKFQS
jgi:hypothetical protein